ncbi:hypothetical protein PIB30_017881 [Stylosanthes scabra]|uniref:Uncharacterized protein n=1 Tax=Stylosanthes scabra TaxID=79078 RepID=A0ABU6Y626_9FABA|nr:hypothetical protein [Stylosanthes scabra]
MAVEVRLIALASKLPPRITFSSEEIKQTTDNRNKSMVISVVTIDTIIGNVFIDQGSSADILFWRCFDALGLTEKDLEAYSDDLVRCSGKRLTPDSFVTLWFSIRNSPDTRNMKVRELVLPKPAKPETAGGVHLADPEPPDIKIPKRAQPARELKKGSNRARRRTCYNESKKPSGKSKSASNPLLEKERGFVCLDSSRRRPKFLQPQAPGKSL